MAINETTTNPAADRRYQDLRMRVAELGCSILEDEWSPGDAGERDAPGLYVYQPSIEKLVVVATTGSRDDDLDEIEGWCASREELRAKLGSASALNRKFCVDEEKHNEAGLLAERARSLLRIGIDRCDGREIGALLETVDDVLERVEQIIDNATIVQ